MRRVISFLPDKQIKFSAKQFSAKQTVFLCCDSLLLGMAAFLLHHSKKFWHLTSGDFSRHETSDGFGRHEAGRSSDTIGCLLVCVDN